MREVSIWRARRRVGEGHHRAPPRGPPRGPAAESSGVADESPVVLHAVVHSQHHDAARGKMQRQPGEASMLPPEPCEISQRIASVGDAGTDKGLGPAEDRVVSIKPR